ncbi:hypothetical protein Sango_0795700 [Sesamum angolense]|uniref:MULE transposase domain-containing protein n=1 Tax=Sesamum angolense TaxID=2727404 RepID=A0AAE2C093_9LAMI|nr:hypothetical protein Sango_0795700 [Sesamum angolense]
MFHRNVVIVEVHEWIHVELITPFGAELHVINLDAEEVTHAKGVEAEGVDQEAESFQAKNVADEAYVEDDENAMQDECDSVRGARQTNEDEDDELISGYSSDDAPLDAGSENEGDEDEDESEDPMNNYLHKNMYEGAEGEDHKIHLEQTDGCSWRIRASPLSGKVIFVIKSLKAEQTCVRVKTMKETNSSWISKRLEVLRDSDMKAKRIRHELQIIVKLQYNHNENDDEEGLVSNIPIVPSFKRTFVGLGPLKKDFLQRCGPFLGFDGCHLKGTYGGLLHPVIAFDGNNGLFPLAFGVVESEYKDNWCFFFQALDEMLGGFGVDRPWSA